MHFYDEEGTMHDSTLKWPDLKEDEQIEKALKAGYIPSVTTYFTILRYPHIEKWLRKITVEHYVTHGQKQQAIEYEDTTASERGTRLHNALEFYLLSDLKAFPTDLSALEYSLVSPFTTWAHKNLKEIIFAERSFGCKTLGYGGTGDFAAINRDNSFLSGDFKFKKHSERYPLKTQIEYGCQLSAYDAYYGPRLADGRQRIRQNFLFNSGLGYSVDPFLKVVTYIQDYMPMMNMIKDIWHALRVPQTSWMEETFAEPKKPKFNYTPHNNDWTKIIGTNKTTTKK